MSEVKFTKGEWELNKYTSTVNGDARVFAYEIWCGNKCVVYKTDIEYPCEDLKKEYLSNAHLIAAAPEMYNLLERLTNPNNCKKDIIHLLGEADSLLAKARGE